MTLVWGVASLVQTMASMATKKQNSCWRWIPNAEDIYLAERRTHVSEDIAPAADGATDDGKAGEASGASLSAAAGDWPAFRGSCATLTWMAPTYRLTGPPPRPCLSGKHKIGPGWSSMTIIGDRLFTLRASGRKRSNGLPRCEYRPPALVTRRRHPLLGFTKRAGPCALPSFANGRLHT